MYIRVCACKGVRESPGNASQEGVGLVFPIFLPLFCIEKFDVIETEAIMDKSVDGFVYGRHVESSVVNDVGDRIYRIIVNRRKFRDSDYSARCLAEDIGVGHTCLSAVMRIRYKCSYSTFVNRCRINEAKKLMACSENDKYTLEDISFMSGFSNRQSFFKNFNRFAGMSPSEYRKKLHDGRIL